MPLKHAKPIPPEVAESYCNPNDFNLRAGTRVDAWFESSDQKHLAAILFHSDQKFWGFQVVRRGESRCEPEQVGRGMLLGRESSDRSTQRKRRRSIATGRLQAASCPPHALRRNAARWLRRPASARNGELGAVDCAHQDGVAYNRIAGASLHPSG